MNRTMQISVWSFWAPKAGNRAHEYEDDYDFSYNRVTRGQREVHSSARVLRHSMCYPRFAVADGATGSVFSGTWAHQLVKLYVAKGPRRPETLRKWVEREVRAWLACVSRSDLPWYAVNKVNEGAFAALVGLSLLRGDLGGGSWTALAVGDSCLFQLRDGALVTRFPVAASEALGYHPWLLSTRADKNATIWERGDELRRTGDWQPGDSFLMMTDALAHWFLRQVEVDEKPWHTLSDLVTASALDRTAFLNWIEELRDAKQLRNDDVTLLIVSVEEA